jgi:cyclopropane-fatty-acyl-phospholipid synthase
MDIRRSRQRVAAEVEILDEAAWGMVAGNGSIGAGEAYIHGYWRSLDLAAVTRLFVANLDVLDAMEGGLARLAARPCACCTAQPQQPRGARRNILAHYDLGNALFERLLDPTMMYSAAQFDSPEQSLEQAQLNKLERICQKLELKPHDHLLEIGSGWGSLAIHAATHHGCRVTTTTLSQAQYSHTLQRVKALGLERRITVLCEDYRDLRGRFDKLVSIEMIEAVATATCRPISPVRALLKDDGLMLLQAITIRDQRYAQARRSVDFIQRYIFPGGALPSLSVLLDTASRQTALNLLHMEDFGQDYARTLRHWRDNLRLARGALRKWATTTPSSACGSSTCATARAVSRSAPSVWRNCSGPHPRHAGHRCRAPEHAPRLAAGQCAVAAGWLVGLRARCNAALAVAAGACRAGAAPAPLPRPQG